jgi:hypothetical protein
MMNLTQQARYLSSNSGGSWFNAAYSYQQLLPVNEFLGPYVRPRDLTMDALKKVSDGSQGAFASTISESSIILPGVKGAVIDAVTGSKYGPGAWSLAVGDAFLKPYNLNSDKSTITTNGTKGPIHRALQQLGSIDEYTYQASYDRLTSGNVPRPFPIILGTIFRRVQASSRFYPVEFTPLYIGCPPVFVNSTNPNATVGGGFVDPQGFNSAPPNPAPKTPAALTTPESLNTAAAASSSNATAAAPVASAIREAQTGPALGTGKHRLLLQTQAAKTNATSTAAAALNAQQPLQTSVDSTFIVPLKVMMGISSSFLAQGLRPDLTGTLAELTGTEDLDYWNQVNFKGERQPFADGGGTDNLAITPLLRRGITNIISCIALVEHIDNSTNMEDWAVSQWDIAALFGAVPLQNKNINKKGQVNGMSPQELNRATQVFPSAAFAKFFNAIKAGIASGGPVYHLATYEVLENKQQAIKGGQQVNVLWVINGLQSNWESQLPADTRGSLAKSRYKKGGLYEGNTQSRDTASLQGDGMRELRMFPYISTFDANYGPELTGLLSQMATWQMVTLRPQIQQLLVGTGAAVAEAADVGLTTSGNTFSNVKGGPQSFASQSRVHWLSLLVCGLLIAVLWA